MAKVTIYRAWWTYLPFYKRIIRLIEWMLPYNIHPSLIKRPGNTDVPLIQYIFKVPLWTGYAKSLYNYGHPPLRLQTCYFFICWGEMDNTRLIGFYWG